MTPERLGQLLFSCLREASERQGPIEFNRTIYYQDAAGLFLNEIRPAYANLLTACEFAQKRFAEMGMDWMGRGPDPLYVAIKKANGAA